MYKLINKQTGEEHICEKVVIDGWDYYVCDEKGQIGDIVIEKYVDGTIGLEQIDTLYDIDLLLQKKVIATNNPSIDIPKVVDEVEILVNKLDTPENLDQFSFDKGFIDGYNKSQETHSNSDDDMIEFNEWCNKNYEFDNRCNHWFHGNGYYTTKELLQLWKEQKPKILYYEQVQTNQQANR